MPASNGNDRLDREEGPTIERRRFAVDELRTTRQDGDDEGGRQIVGHAAVFDQETVINTWLGKFREKIAPGAFADTIANDDVRALWNHNTDTVLGRNLPGREANTLSLVEDETGLLTEIDPPSWADPQLESIERGDVTGMSFAFEVLDHRWEKGDEEEGELDLRTILKVRLFEVSPVTFPAYEQTDVGVREEDVDVGGWREWRAAQGAPLQESATVTTTGSVDNTPAPTDADTGEEEPQPTRDTEDGESTPDAEMDVLRRRQRLAELEAAEVAPPA